MNHVRAATSTGTRRQVAWRIGQVARRRRYATQPSHPPPPPPPPQQQPPTAPHEPSRVGTYYKSFGSPVLKCFLGALFTYQVVYYAWLKLEAAEEAHDTAAEISHLQQELRDAVAQQAQGAGEMVRSAAEGVREKAGEVKEEVVATGKSPKKGGWFW